MGATTRNLSQTAAHQKAIYHERALKAWKTRHRNAAAAGAGAGAGAGGPVSAHGDWHVDSERKLSDSPITKQKKLGGGISESYKVTLEDGTRGVFKPSDTERSGVRPGISAGQGAEREAGAWEVAKAVGLDDMVAPTVVRTVAVPGYGFWPKRTAKGSLAQWQNGTEARNIADQKRKYDGEEDRRRAAMFDFIIGNQDRHSGNWVIGDTNDKLRLIDHGLSFGETKVDYGRGNHAFLNDLRGRDSWGRRGGRVDRSDPSKYAKRYGEQKSVILSRLRALGLPRAAIDHVGRRIDRAQTATSWEDLLS